MDAPVWWRRAADETRLRTNGPDFCDLRAIVRHMVRGVGAVLGGGHVPQRPMDQAPNVAFGIFFFS